MIMPVDREQWSENFSELPHWQCPTCRKGHLIPLPDKVLNEETGPSLAERDHPAWEPNWIKARFAGFIKCSSPACGDVASISGDAFVDVFEYLDEYEHIQTESNLYVVKSICPAPIPIRLPEAVPDNIKEAVEAASALVWASSEAAGNRMRQVVELFLTDVGIPAKTKTGDFISTHSRIEQFQKIDSENGDALLAAKWLGNSSSHPGGISREDVLNAFDMVEFVLESRYGTAMPALKAKIAAIIAHKGPTNKTAST
jgi:Domain of unknown function (DUF4145)